MQAFLLLIYLIFGIPAFAEFSSFFRHSPISGRKLAYCYACINYVPNTVLNFGIFIKILYIFINKFIRI